MTNVDYDNKYTNIYKCVDKVYFWKTIANLGKFYINFHPQGGRSGQGQGGGRW